MQYGGQNLKIVENSHFLLTRLLIAENTFVTHDHLVEVKFNMALATYNTFALHNTGPTVRGQPNGIF